MDDEKVKLALDIATKAHQGQKDKSGYDYIGHPIRDAKTVRNRDEIVVALLHDTIEDTYVTPEYLAKYFDKNIVDAVVLLTKRNGENYTDFVLRCKTNILARNVKIADILDNLDLSRINKINEEDIERNKKYLQALKILIFD